MKRGKEEEPLREPDRVWRQDVESPEITHQEKPVGFSAGLKGSGSLSTGSLQGTMHACEKQLPGLMDGKVWSYPLKEYQLPWWLRW